MCIRDRDHRLLHGQVAFSWTTNLGADCILIANDGIMHDDLRKTTVKLSKPAGTKLVIKNIEDSIAAILSLIHIYLPPSITFYHSFGQVYFKRMLAVFSYLWVTAEKMRIEEKRKLCYNFS